MSLKVAYYITGHGFGHATRSLASIRALFEAAKTRGLELELEIQSALAPFIFRELRGLEPGLSFRARRVDVGFIQKDGVSIDHPATVRELSEVVEQFDRLAETEAAYLAHEKFGLVIVDVPAAPILAAHRANIPSVAIANFDWAFIYDAYRSVDPVYARAVDQFSAAYAKTSLLLRLPFAPAMDIFPRRRDVPLVVRSATATRDAVRRQLGIADDPRPLVLISFGGLGLGRFGLEGFDEPSVAAIDEVLFVAFGERREETPPNVLRIADDAFHFPNLVSAADAVITKTGYGIVSEAVAGHTGLLYTPRPDFPEYRVIAEVLGDFIPAAEVAIDELCSGAFAAKLRAIIPKTSSRPRCRVDGAAVVAAEILDRYEASAF